MVDDVDDTRAGTPSLTTTPPTGGRFSTLKLKRVMWNRLGGVAGLPYLRLRVRPWPMLVDFHDAENQQRPCRMIIRHVKYP
ncbi:hypothetical protein TNCV_4502651 [Trichonephila clavipes]|nr:hypothetical protein TNCV_4502651 [Trichonephila clavipes]